jgi:acetylornithine deacetylase/succinyl-diaminopimelate desuccinylase-like protein
MRYTLLLIFFISVHANAQQDASAPVRNYRVSHEHEILREYFNFLSVPNVAADPGSLEKNAALIMEMMKKRGIGNVQLLQAVTKGVAPAVYGEVLVPGAKQTIIFYAHYDGQPVNAANWQKGLDPFKPQLAKGVPGPQLTFLDYPANGSVIDPEWRIYGRSTSDDKAGVMSILTAYQAITGSGNKPGVNIKFFFEGEEEAGSDHLEEILSSHKDLLRSDLWIICDGPVHQSGRKEVVFGVRGDTHVEITVFGPKKPLHSGHYGNWVPNPAMDLVQLVASMKNEKGEVTIDKFYDDVTPLSDAEKKALAAIPGVEAQMKKELGITREERKMSLPETYSYPSLNINGIRSADVGKLSANVIPVKATVSIDLRLVVGNDWKRQQDKVIDHIKKQGYYVTEQEPTDEDRAKYERIAMVTRASGYNAQKTSMDLPEAKKVIAAVQSTTKDNVVLLPTSGGSLPLFVFEKVLSAKTISVPVANHDNNQHAENENIRLKNLWDGIETMAALMMMK